jgi:hypothetical protein
VDQRVLRDADLLYVVMLGEPDQVLEGLRAEASVTNSVEVSYQTAHEKQLKFMSQVKLFTEHGRLWYQEQQTEFIRRFNAAYFEKTAVVDNSAPGTDAEQIGVETALIELQKEQRLTVEELRALYTLYDHGAITHVRTQPAEQGTGVSRVLQTANLSITVL